jgi:enamine deaminase RidA (YjgF/YER057c/UK114 family)
MKDIDTLLREKNIVLPQPARPVANYRPAMIAGSQLIISGQLPLGPDGTLAPNFIGAIGSEITAQDGALAARLCAINILAQAQAALGSLNRITQCLRLGGFIRAADGFHAIAGVMNGASDLMVDVFGAKGEHARSTIGVASLPLNACVEIEALFAIDGDHRVL